MPTMRGGWAKALAQAAPAAPVPHPRSTSTAPLRPKRLGQRMNDRADEKKVQRRVKQRKGRALAGAVERATLTKTPPPLDVSR